MQFKSVAGVMMFLAGFCCKVVFAANPFLQALVETRGGVVVTYGTNPSSLTAANVIADAIKQIQPSWNNLRTAAAFDADTFLVTGQTHVIAVGTLMDSKVLQARGMLPIKWLDRDYYYGMYNTLFRATVSPDSFNMPYLPRTGFVVANFGDWPSSEKGIGIIECDRSNYMIEWTGRKRIESAGVPNQFWSGNGPAIYPMNCPLYLVVRITGSGDSGVVAAARAFTNNNLLNGVVLNGSPASTGPDAWELPASKYVTTLPFAPPTTGGTGSNTFTYLGWIECDQGEYTTTYRATTLMPEIMYRVKYLPSWKIKNFWSSPMREASELEVVAMKFASSADATSAETKFKALLQTKAWKDKVTGFNTAVSGRYLYMESIPEPAGAAILAGFSSLTAW